MLDIVDDRTLQGLLRRCGCDGPVTPSLELFFANQRLITSRHNLAAVIDALRNHGVGITALTMSPRPCDLPADSGEGRPS